MRQHFAYCAPLNFSAQSPSYTGSDLVTSPEGPDVARLPDELRGIRIVVTPASTGVPWTTTVTQVVSRSEDDVVVRHAGRPGNDR